MAKTYDTYKDSGIAWIDMIPKGWKALPFKSIFYTEKGLNITKADLTETGVPVLSYGQIHSKQNTGTCLNEELFKFVPRSYLKTNPECLVQKGCLLIADTSEDYEGCGNAIYVDSNKTLFAGYHTIIARPYNIGRDYKYFAYLLLTDNWRQQVRSCVSGIKVYSVNQKILKQTSVIFPPLPEQEAIATYLDEKCGEIDSLISLQEEMISELQAYKKSVITEAVTKGLDPNVPMKDSGVEWLGNIPEHWEVKQLKYCITINSGDALSNEKILDNGQYPVFGGGERIGYYNFYNTESSELIVGRVGARCGCVTMPNCLCWATDNALKISSSLPIRYTYYLLCAAELNTLNTSNAQPLITSTKIKNKKMPLSPNIEEQQAIASYLDEKISQIDSLIALKQEKITELKDYKKSIIYEYVTGKKKV